MTVSVKGRSKSTCVAGNGFFILFFFLILKSLILTCVPNGFFIHLGGDCMVVFILG